MSKINVLQISTIPSQQCQICAAHASCSNFGALSCSACKMFFKRNAEKRLEHFQCNFIDDCQISANTRRICSACRLRKCFLKGMQTDLIRCPTSTNNKHKRKNRQITELTVFSTLNLLQSDQSTLTNDQWILLSNLIHSYDEYGGYPLAKDFISKQNTFPLKLRYKIEPVEQFVTSNISRVQQIFEKNGDYLSLSLHDRLILLQHTVKHTGCFGGTFNLHQANLLDDPLFYQTTEMLFGSDVMSTIRHLIHSFDSDIVFVKLTLIILAFSTTSYTIYTNTSANNLIDIKTVLRIQNIYVELAWRYMIYKYNFEQAVKRFSDLLRCLFHVHHTIVEVNKVEEYTNIIDSVVEQTKQILAIHEN